MTTTFLVEHRWIPVAILVLLVGLGPPLGGWLAGRPRVARGLAVLAALPVLLLTLAPVDRELFARCAWEWTLPTPDRVELFANVALFAPPVFLAAVASRRPLPTVVLGSAASAAIEALQAAVPAIGRSCSSDDWVSNSAGAVIGGAVAVAALWLAGRRTARAGRAA